MIKKLKIDSFSVGNKFNTLKENKFYKINLKTMMDFDPSKDYYKILGIEQNATEKQIKESYFKLAKKHHPDVNDGKTTEMFKEMTNAYDILSDKNKKKQYDEYRGMFKNQSTQHQNPYYSSQAGQNNDNNYDKTGYGKNTGEYKTRTTYTYRDPKTGEYKSKTYEGDFQGNPFFKDFEDFFKRANTSNQNNTQRNFRGKSGFNNFGNFNDFNNFHDPYSQRGNYYNDQHKQKNEKFNWNPQHNQWDYDYLNYLYAKRIFKLFFIGTTIIFVISMLQGRSRQRYYDDMMLQQPYVTFTPYPPNANLPPGGVPVNQYTPPYPPTGVIPPAYNKNDVRYVNDPYVNPYFEPKLR
jgi:curved DNA-binding protein CbpA